MPDESVPTDIFDPDHWLAPTAQRPASWRDAWLDLCTMATEPERGLFPGQIRVSIRLLSERWHWSKSNVSRFLGRLINTLVDGTGCGTGLEEVCGTPLGTVYRVENYDTYGTVENSLRDTPEPAMRDRLRDTRDRPPPSSSPSSSPPLLSPTPPYNPSTPDSPSTSPPLNPGSCEPEPDGSQKRKTQKNLFGLSSSSTGLDALPDSLEEWEWGDLACWYRLKGYRVLWQGEEPPTWANDSTGRPWTIKRGLSVLRQLWAKGERAPAIVGICERQEGPVCLLRFNRQGRWDVYYTEREAWRKANEMQGNRFSEVLAQLTSSDQRAHP